MEKCRKMADKYGESFEDWWLLYDPENNAEWVYMLKYIGFLPPVAIACCIILSPLYLGWNDMLPGVLQDIFDWIWSSVLGIVIFVIGLPSILFAVLTGKH